MIGKKIQERYLIEKEIGVGGMGVVYRAEDTLLKRDVAVKLLKLEGMNAQNKQQMLREAQFSAQLNHPNIVTTYDVGEINGMPYIVMELVNGVSLFDSRPGTIPEIISVCHMVCNALQHAHEHNIIHRDLKPENILITTGGEVKLMDFGLARLSASRITDKNMLSGTVYYLAPELINGETYDRRADLYALGVIMYELLTGEHPFQDENVITILSKHLNEPALPPVTLNPQISGELNDLIMRLLEKSTDRRPASAREVLRILDKVSLMKPTGAGNGLAGLTIAALGGLEVRKDGQPVAGLTSKKAEALLVYLACADRPVSREVLAELLWHGRNQRRAMSNLRVILTILRKSVGDYITITRDAVALNSSATVVLDATRFQDLINSGEYEKAIDIYQGDFLKGLFLRDARDFEEWLGQQSYQLKRQYLDSLAMVVERSLSSGDYAAGIRHARDLLNHDPTRETAHQKLMYLYTFSGQRGAALEQYQQFWKILGDELGLEPSQQTRDLYQDILDEKLKIPQTGTVQDQKVYSKDVVYQDDETSFVPPPLTEREQEILGLLAGGLSNREIARELVVTEGTVKWFNKKIFRKLGVSSRSKAVAKARSVGLLEGDFQQVPDEERSAEINLPAQLTPFVGRKADLEELSSLLSDPAIRLVNILGPGGIGKTRLAVESAREQLGAFGDGVFFVPLAAFEDPELLATPIAKAIELPFLSGSQTESNIGDQQNQQLINYLRDRKILLVLDNLEHLLEGLPFLADILQSAAGVKMLTTSRERLNLQAETIYTLGSMQVRDGLKAADLVEAENLDALQLFVSCAKRVQPGFELEQGNLNDVIEICRLVDGLPLGIELAAAWTGLLTPKEIAKEIRTSLNFLSSDLKDLPDRQRSMHSVFEYSWERLTGDEQRAFRQLTVFRGGFTREAAERVAGASLPLLMALANKSLINTVSSGRFNIHELLRQIGREKLEKAGETAQTREKHLAFYLQLSEETELKIQGADQVRWLNELDLENDNFRSALEWSRTDMGNTENGLLLAGTFWHYWSIRSYFYEGRRYLNEILADPEAKPRSSARAKALNAAGHLAYLQSDYPTSQSLLEESISIYRELGDSGRHGLAEALIILGDMYSELAEYEKAVELFNEALEIMREQQDKRGIARAYWQLGQCAVRPGDYDRAVEYYEKALPLLREINDRSHTSIAVSGLAEIAIRRGDYERAYKLEEESLALRCEINETWGIAISLANFAWIEMNKGNLQEAKGNLGESLELRREIGDVGGTAWCLEKMAEISIIEGQQGSNHHREHEFQRAARLYGAAQALRAPINSHMDLVDQPRYEQLVEKTRKQLGEQAFTAAWDEGGAMTLDKAVDYALGRMDK